MHAPDKSIIDAYLEEQQRLQTPVALFADEHEQGLTPALEPVYRNLIPLSAPKPGEQYAFEVELDSCTGCKACVSACHSLNGLDENEAWRDVGLLIGGTPAAPFQQNVTTACHHCADPACLNGCPVLAYEKDPCTGIVRHLDDQCIGCQYCVMMCPYDVPKYNERLGIVRKCDMCHQRLGAGEAPACVQACPTHAIRIVTVGVQRSETPQVDTSQFLRGAPDPSITQPSTRYVSSRPQPGNLHAADATVLWPQPAHWPLVFMLTLMPVAVGVQTALLLPANAHVPALAHWIPVVAGLSGLVAAVFHLGQPWRAWRVFLGLNRSWFSREAVLFGAWAGFTFLSTSMRMLASMAAFTGVLGLLCSVMIYVDTRRTSWRFSRTFPAFFGTAVVMALAITLPHYAPAAMAVKLLFDTVSWAGDSVTARLRRGLLRGAVQLRLALGGGALGLFVVCDLLKSGGPVFEAVQIAAASLALGGEFAERSLFFRAVDSAKMPGMPAPEEK